MNSELPETGVRSRSGSQQSGARSRLTSFLKVFEGTDFVFATSHGGGFVAPDSLVAPFVEFSQPAKEFLEAAYADGWVLQGFDWSAWSATSEARALLEDGTGIQRASPEQLAKLLTVLIRQDRFCEGALADSFDSGLLTAVLRRLRVLEEQTGIPANRPHPALYALRARDRRGSKPRCHWLTYGDRPAVAVRLTQLVKPWGTVSDDDHWMPNGFHNPGEAQLHKPTALVDPGIARQLAAWWLPADRPEATTPSFDLASTCTIEGVRGVLLVEAKAHDAELDGEACGRRLDKNASVARKASHATIKTAISLAAQGLSRAIGSRCSIERDRCYQMSNRFAWAWKLADLGVPVVLVYLGFLRANEMCDRGTPFEDSMVWSSLVSEHSEPLFATDVWNRPIDIQGVPLIPRIASIETSYDAPTTL